MTAAAPSLADLRSRTVVSIAEASAWLNMSQSAGYRAVARGDLPTILVNGRRRVPVAPLLALVGLEYETEARP